MTVDQPKFRRMGEERRRDDLIAAALDLMAEGGPESATVRAIAARAGATPGLIRYYFSTKDDLWRAAYRTHMTRLTEQCRAAIPAVPRSPGARLTAFVVASLSPPVTDGAALRLWAGFIGMAQRNPAMNEIHETTYLLYRDALQELIAALPGRCDTARLRTLAIACNGVLDGLWLEGCALPDKFADGELARIGVESMGAILGEDLLCHLAPGAADPRPA